MSLAAFIRSNIEPITAVWEEFAATMAPAGAVLSVDELRDHVPDLLLAVATDIEADRTPKQQELRARGAFEQGSEAITRYSREHAQTRLQQGFDLHALGAEYRALRENVLRLWAVPFAPPAVPTTGSERMRSEPAAPKLSSPLDARDQFRFNQSIDQAWTEAMAWYGQQLEEARNFMLSALAHDLRNPLGAVQMSARLLLQDPGLSDESEKAATRIFNSSSRMRDLVDQLLDFTRIRLGHRMPVRFAMSDAEAVLRDTVEELRAYHPGVEIRLECEGDLSGEWDGARIAQMLSNLVGNAIEHGETRKPVSIAAHGKRDGVVISIHNQGPAIPSVRLTQLFDPTARRLIQQQDEAQPALGLGLLIASEIVAAHRGRISVTSSDDGGTLFTVEIPKAPSVGDTGASAA
jgi:signal transduction histidine kinase